MVSKITFVVFHVLLCLEFCPAKAQTWIKAGYWLKSELPVSNTNSTLYTHLLYAFANLSSTSYELISETQFSSFIDGVRQQNPTITTLLSIGGGNADYETLSSMVSNPSNRKSFIDSSIRLARSYSFQGLDFSWVSPRSSSDTSNMGILFKEWRAAIDLEVTNSNQSQLILTAAVIALDSRSYPIVSMEENLDWIHVNAYDYYTPKTENFTRAYAALHDPNSNKRTDYAITTWIDGGLSANKLVLGLPFYGYAWTLLSSEDNGIGATATGPAIYTNAGRYGDIGYKDIKERIEQNGVNVVYNATYVVNYCSIGTSWIGFDDVEAVRAKVSYAKEKNLRGYYVWHVSNDHNWVLSRAAADQEEKKDGQSSWRLLVSVLTPISAFIVLLGFLIYCCRIRKLNSSKGKKNSTKGSKTGVDFNGNGPNLMVYNFVDIEAATDKFSFENKLGEGGYGPVYKGLLLDGQEIAVKKLSKTSKQGFEEFKNEVMLTAKLQHVNLVRLFGFCIDRGEQMLIYEYMPNKSLDYYLFDPIKRLILDWNKRVDIIEGVCQGLLYLQEYSRLTVIHRDLKAGNVLLDENMKPKISDFGMARIFTKDGFEANTERIVGTYGYIPPEYARRGIYSTKFDVYSFGVLLLQIISGKKVSILYGENESLSLLEFAYKLWRDGKGMEIFDSSLDDTGSSCKLLKCLLIALLCVQEVSDDRPTMLEVSSMLKSETTGIMIPKTPAFWRQTNEIGANKSTPQPVVHSVDDATITEMVPR